MIGLILLAAFGLYVVVSIVVVTITYRTAKRSGASPTRARRAAGVAALVMYLLLFWDWVPTVVAKQYYCRTQGGFYLYKTLDQWKQENPGVAKTLTWKLIPDKTDSIYDPVTGTQTYLLNERFLREIRQQKLWLLAVTVEENRLLDRKTAVVLARHVDVTTGYGNPMVAEQRWGGWKFWLSLTPCDGIARPSLRTFEDMSSASMKIGDQP